MVEGAAWDDEPVTTLSRWEASGALWRVLLSRSDAVVIGLFTCDGGEEAARIRCAPEAVSSFLSGRLSSSDPGSA